MKIIKSTLIIVLLASGSVYAQDNIVLGDSNVTGGHHSFGSKVNKNLREGALNIQWGFESDKHDHKLSCKNRPAGCPILTQ